MVMLRTYTCIYIYICCYETGFSVFTKKEPFFTHIQTKVKPWLLTWLKLKKDHKVEASYVIEINCKGKFEIQSIPDKTFGYMD